MDYQLRKAISNNNKFIYDVKKVSIYKYVDEIWGWNENIQKDFFAKDFMNLEEFDIICHNGIDIGFVQPSNCNNSINITEIHIIPEYQGKGIGTNIIKELINEGKLTNKFITLGCFKNNIRAKNLYFKLGFDLAKETSTHFVLEYKVK